MTKTRIIGRVKTLSCYFLCWGSAVAIPLASLRWFFPFKLVGSSPAIAQNLSNVFSFLQPALAGAAADAVLEGKTGEMLSRAMAARDGQWCLFVALCFVTAWLISLTIQLCWRGLFVHAKKVAQATTRAIRLYLLSMLAIVGVNAFVALICYLLGVQFVEGRNGWDYLLYFGGYVLNALAADLCFRLAAPAVISGRNAFFKRL